MNLLHILISSLLLLVPQAAFDFSPENNSEFHPFHVSVMSIHHASDENTLQITLKLFADDLEEALNDEQFKKPDQPFVDVLNPKDPQELNVLVEKYLRNHFNMKVNGNEVDAAFLGKEVEDMAMWCYFEISDVSQLKSIQVRSSIMTEIFDDQINIVHVNYGGVIKSMKLAGNHLLDEISFG